jgi:hypothetical protein
VQDAEDRRVLRSFATWHVLHRLRASQIQRQVTANVYYRCRAELAATARFLAGLRRQGRDLATCRQSDIDQATSRPSTMNLLSFLRWATCQKHLPELRLPKPPPDQPRHFTDGEDHWTVARRLLHEQSISTADRVSGLLVLLYAQMPARIVRLTVNDITDRNSWPQLRLGRGAITLPEPLAELACRLPEREPDGIAASLAVDSPWLFPGRGPSTPMHPANMGRRLAALGIDPRSDRNTALLQLATELPVPVIADLLGIHIVTADRWAQAASVGWTTYAAIRAPSQQVP